MTQTFDLRNLSPSIPKRIKRFDPSYVTRYVIVTELIKQAVKREDLNKQTVLDVGGYDGAIRDLLPDTQITILDVQDDKKLKDYVKVDSTKLPFKDGSFDFVVSCDTLEHIPPQLRDEFISEMVRVSRKNVFIGAPFGTVEVENTEESSNAFYDGMTKQDYVWLKEHKEYVLPKKEWLEGLLKELKVNYKTIEHTSLELWGHMLRNNFFLPGNIGAVNKKVAANLSAFNQYYLDNFAFEDFPSSGYRTFFVISKKNQISVLLPEYNYQKCQSLIVRHMRLLGESLQNITREYGILLDQQKKSIKVYRHNQVLLADLNMAEQQLSSKAHRFVSYLGKVKKFLKTR